MTWRQFGVLLRGLPSTSRYQTKVRDTVEFDEPEPGSPERFGPWGTEHYQLAALIDSVRNLQRTLVQVNTEKDVPPVEPMPRPATKIRKHVSAEAVAAFEYLQAIRDRHAKESQ